MVRTAIFIKATPMPQQTISISQDFSQNLATVFALVSEHDNLGRVFGIPVSRIKDGSDAVNGLGSVRRMGPWPLGTQETVTEYTPNERVAYQITKFGGPIRNHRGEVLFSKQGDGSRVTWNITFDTFPEAIGTGVKGLLETALRSGLRRLARSA